MQQIPIRDVPNQQVQVSLAGQQCQIHLYQLSTGFFCDLLVSNEQIVAGIICQDRNRVVRDIYLGFIGDLCFMDTQGTSDPVSPGLNSRFMLVYLDAFDLAPGEG